jgi:hypothetical protein
LLGLVIIDGDRIDEPLDNVVGLQTLRLGVEVGDDSVPQHRIRDGSNVFNRDVIATMENGASLAGKHEILACARAGSPAHIITDKVRHFSLFSTCTPGETNGIPSHVVGHRNLTDDFLKVENIFPG